MSNLGSSLGVALAGSVLAADAFPGNRSFAVSLIIMIVIAVIGFVAALLIPKDGGRAATTADPSAAP